MENRYHFAIPLFLRLLFIFCPYSFIFVSCERDFSNLNKAPQQQAVPDTTSHHFTWKMDTLGIGGRGSSYLMDVATIDENDIWAVGEIHTAETDTFDSLGNWMPPYNAAHWNGQKWQMVRFLQETGNVILPIRGILYMNQNNVWLAAGSIYYWNGNSDKRTNLSYKRDINTGELIKRLWSVSNSNIYGIGTEGIIVRYNSSTWQKLDSPNSVDIQDIWGAMNPRSGEYEILAVASFGPSIPQARKLLMIQGNTVTNLPDIGLPLNLRGVWFIPDEKYYVTGDGVFFTHHLGEFWQPDTTHPLIYKDAIRGNELNDIMIVGSFGLVSHYNGLSWRHYTGIELPSFYGRYHRLDFKKDFMVAVGSINGAQAIILRGFRN